MKDKSTHDSLEESLNNEAEKILLIIKEDYFENMSERKKEVMKSLLNEDKVVLVNKGTSIFKDNTLAHGGRVLKDGKIHFYPDTRDFASEQEKKKKCLRILPHEIFHFFLQPDAVELDSEREIEMARFYTEGLVERETRRFCENHPEIAFEKANYGFNINFVNKIQGSLGAINNDVIFSENDYLKSIGNYTNEYNNNLKNRNHLLYVVKDISIQFPKELRQKFYNRARTMLLQDGNAKSIIEKLKTIDRKSVV